MKRGAPGQCCASHRAHPPGGSGQRTRGKEAELPSAKRGSPAPAVRRPSGSASFRRRPIRAQLQLHRGGRRTELRTVNSPGVGIQLFFHFLSLQGSTVAALKKNMSGHITTFEKALADSYETKYTLSSDPAISYLSTYEKERTNPQKTQISISRKMDKLVYPHNGILLSNKKEPRSNMNESQNYHAQ